MNSQAFITHIEEKLGITNMPAQVKEQVITGVTENILKRTIIELVANLSDKEAKKMNESLEAGTSGDMLQEILTAHPSLETRIKEITEQVLAEVTERNASN